MVISDNIFSPNINKTPDLRSTLAQFMDEIVAYIWTDKSRKAGNAIPLENGKKVI
jgi:hypothetical protein